jgi:hypothetical protein
MRCSHCAVGQVLAMGGDGLHSSGVWRDLFWLLVNDISGHLVGTKLEGRAVQAQLHNTENWISTIIISINLYGQNITIFP